MNLLAEITSHVEELESAIKSSSSGLLARVLATLKADWKVAAAFFVVGAIIGHVL